MSISTTSGVLIAVGMSAAILSMILLSLSFFSITFAHLFLVVVSSGVFLVEFSRGIQLIIFLEALYNYFTCLVLNKCSRVLIYVVVVLFVYFSNGKSMIDSNMNANFHRMLLLCKKGISG